MKLARPLARSSARVYSLTVKTNLVDMPNLEEVYERMQDKKRETREIARSFKDELAQHPRYPQLMEEYEKLRAEKKSIENEVRNASSADATKLETLKLDIKSDKEMLSDIALNMYAEGKTVEIVDRNNARWVPQFSVNFKKEESSQEEIASFGAAALQQAGVRPSASAAEEEAKEEATEPDFAP